MFNCITLDSIQNEPADKQQFIMDQVFKSEDLSGDRSSLAAFWELVPFVFTYSTTGVGGWVAQQSSITMLSFGVSDQTSDNWVFSGTDGATEGFTTQLPKGFFTKDCYFSLTGMGFQIVGSPVAVALSGTKVDLTATATINTVNAAGPLTPRNDCKSLTADFWRAATQASYLEFKEAGRKCASVFANVDQCPAGVGVYESASNGITMASNIRKIRRSLVAQPSSVNGDGVRIYQKNSVLGSVMADPSYATPTAGDDVALLVKAYYFGYISDANGNVIANETERYCMECQSGRIC